MVSFSLVLLLIPVIFLIMIKGIFPQILKNVKYKIKHHSKKTTFDIGKAEAPLLVLKYNGQNVPALKCIAITVFVMPLIVFCFASSVAREDMHRTFLFLNSKQTYVLYYWAWNFVGLFTLLWGGSIFITAFNKSLLFFKAGVILSNSLTGSKEFVLDKDIWLVKSPKMNIYWLYDDLKGTKVQIFNRKLMRLEPQHEKLLAEFISRIPEKRKTFYI